MEVVVVVVVCYDRFMGWRLEGEQGDLLGREEGRKEGS